MYLYRCGQWTSMHEYIQYTEILISSLYKHICGLHAKDEQYSNIHWYSKMKAMKNNEQQWMKLKNVFSCRVSQCKWRWTARAINTSFFIAASNSKLHNFQTEMVLSTQLKRPTKKLRRFQNPETRIPGPNTISPKLLCFLGCIPRYCQCITRSTAGDGPQLVTVGAHGFENEFPDFFPPNGGW